jgi:hypothetical protein
VVSKVIHSQDLTASVAVPTNLDGLKEVGEKFTIGAAVGVTPVVAATGTIKGNKT